MLAYFCKKEKSNRSNKNHHTPAAVRHRNTSIEQKQRNTNSETKTHILVHQKRHLTMKRSATHVAHGLAFHKTAYEWRRSAKNAWLTTQLPNLIWITFSWPIAFSLVTNFCLPMSTVVKTSAVVFCSSSLGSRRPCRTSATRSHPWSRSSTET